jgi:hypothetical protein
MKKYLSLIVLFSFCAALSGQYAQTQMKVAETEHDFGKFKEEAGRQTYDFTVTNIGKDPLVIQNVVASCGCTTPEWTKQPIAPGANGRVTAIYDPKDRPGVFNKTLTVYSNSKPETIVLVIKGEVIPHEKTVDELFTFPVGAVRFESNHMAFTDVKKTEKKIRVMQLINTSAAPVKVEFTNVPAHLTLKANPETLKPGEKGIVEGTYDATKNSNWGNVSDMVKVVLNGAPQENVFYYISANLIEDFSGLSKEDLENAPVFKVEKNTMELGKIKGNTQNEVEFKFTNLGKNDLVVRHVRASCGCTAVQQGILGIGIKSGQTSSIKATFNSGSYKGPVTKAIYVYTNDPKNSQVVLMLNATVEQPEAAK